MDISAIVNQVDPISALAITAMTVAVVELIKRIFKHEWEAVAYIVASGIVGVLVGLLLNVDPVYACILGFAASGVYKLGQVVSATQNNVITATKQP